MNDNRLPGAIIGRMSRVRTMESRLFDRIEEVRTATAIDRAPGENFTRLSALAASHRLALEEVARLRGAELNRLEPTGVHREGKRALSELLEDAVSAATSALVAYGALYATARLLYENEVCDLADAHAAEWARELAALNDFLAPAVHDELLSEGLTCRCICPTCGIGACGCTRNSIDTIRGYSGRPELEPSDGLELRVAPRPGSPLWQEGLERGDRIIAIDGELVHTNPEIQRALRGHPIGNAMTMQVIRAGNPHEIRVARVSDHP
ncbi:MAG: PDZ domain-containing protein [Chloroflexi bacterium]|nr:MAG: PDZ domain-containing protein [Chloroflexota bacterium]